MTRNAYLCWRCGAPRSSLQGSCSSCNRLCPRVRHRRWRRRRSSGWQLRVGGEAFLDLNHNALMWYVARAAIERGISPEDLRRHFARNPQQRWFSLKGRHDIDTFVAAARSIWTREDEVDDRFQMRDDDDLFWFGGHTWALTSQLGAHTGEYVRSIGIAYPQLQLSLSGGA